MKNLQLKLFNCELESYKQAVINSVGTSENEISEILIPMSEWLRNVIKKSFLGESWPPHFEDFFSNELDKKFKTFTRYENLKKVLLDFPYFFPQITVSTYNSVVFQENYEISKTLDEKRDFTFKAYNSMDRKFERNTKESINGNLMNISRLIDSIPMFSHPYFFFNLTLYAGDIEEFSFQEKTRKDMIKIWGILKKNAFPTNYKLVTEPPREFTTNKESNNKFRNSLNALHYGLDAYMNGRHPNKEMKFLRHQFKAIRERSVEAEKKVYDLDNELRSFFEILGFKNGEFNRRLGEIKSYRSLKEFLGENVFHKYQLYIHKPNEEFPEFKKKIFFEYWGLLNRISDLQSKFENNMNDYNKILKSKIIPLGPIHYKVSS